MVVGLTGGIGSGKSTVARLFELIGCAVFYSDTVAKDVYFDKSIRPKIKSLLGHEAYLGEMELNKKYISARIFSNTDLLHQLNSIIHPAVIEKFKTFKALNSQKLIIKETALLFEAKLEKEVDKIILVAADDNLRIKRVMLRDGLTEHEVISKIKAQLPQEEKALRSDFVINNNEEEFVITQALTIYKKLTHA